MSTATVLGDQFSFGYDITTAPVGLAGFVARTGDFKRELEVYAMATDGNGATEAIQVAKKTHRKITASFNGYMTTALTTTAAKTAVQSGGLLVTVDGSAKSFIIKSIKISKKKGEFADVTVDAEYFPLLTGFTASGTAPTGGANGGVNTLLENGSLGPAYVFGFQTADAPAVTGFSARNADLTIEPEVYSEAKDGEGFTTALARTGPKITASFGGYLTAASLAVLDETFLYPPTTGDFYIIKGISDPRRKGEFVEATLEAESYENITSA